MILLAATLICVVLGALVLTGVAAGRSAEVDGRGPFLVPFVATVGCLLLALSVALVGITLFGLYDAGGLADLGVEFLIVGVFATLVIGPAGVLQILYAISLRKAGHHDLGQRHSRLSMLVATAGYVLACGPVLVVIPPLAGFIIAAVLVAQGHRRRSMQQTLLWHLATAAGRDVPLVEELDACAESVGGGVGRELHRVADAVAHGASVSSALNRSPSLVPRSAILAARVGEKTGALPEALQAEAARLSSRLRGNSAAAYISGLIAYVSIVGLVLIQMVLFCGYYIIPKYKELLEDFDVPLPDATRATIVMSDSLLNAAPLVVPGILLLFVICIGAAEVYRRGWQNLELSWLTRYFPRLDAPGILRNLAWAVRKQAPLPAALTVLAEGHHRPHIRRRLQTAADATANGGDVWLALQSQGFLRGPEVELLASAAAVGNLPWALDALAERMERRREIRMLWWFEALRPWPVLLVGLAAATFALGMFLPVLHIVDSLD